MLWRTAGRASAKPKSVREFAIGAKLPIGRGGSSVALRGTGGSASTIETNATIVNAKENRRNSSIVGVLVFKNECQTLGNVLSG